MCEHIHIRELVGNEPVGLIYCEDCKQYVLLWAAVNTLLRRLWKKEQELDALLERASGSEKGGPPSP